MYKVNLIFLDRDGVINKDPGGWTKYSYVTRWEEFHFLPGSKEALKKLKTAGYEIILISNQAGINKGHYTMDDLKDINSKMLAQIRQAGGNIRSMYYCPHRKDENCACRKPGTGLFEKAAKEIDVDFNAAFFVGDGSTDIEAGKKKGLNTILLLSGKSRLEDVKDWKYKPDYIKKDLLEAVEWILEEK